MKEVVKVVGFLACLSGCLTAIITNFLKYRKFELGSNIDIVSKYNTKYPPNFAICFNNEEFFNNSQCGKKAFGIIQNRSLANVSACELKPFINCIFQPHELNWKLFMVPQGQYGTDFWKKSGYATNPGDGEKCSEWQVFVHPKMGLCFQVQPPERQMPLEYVIFDIPWTSHYHTLNRSAVVDGLQAPSQTFLWLAVFQPGSFIKRSYFKVTEVAGSEILDYEINIIDKRQVDTYANCTLKYDKSQSEDDCLLNCFAKRYVDKNKCIHPRLA